MSSRSAATRKPETERALEQRGVAYALHRSSPTELLYEVTVPFEQKIRPLTKLIQRLDGQDGTVVEWEIKKYETLRP